MHPLTEAEKAAILESLSASLNVAEGRPADSDNGDVMTDEGDVIAGLRDYIEGTQPLDRRPLAEVAFAWLAGYEHATANTDTTRRAYGALRKAGLVL